MISISFNKTLAKILSYILVVNGERYIYSVIDWGGNPGLAAAYSVGITIAIVLCHAGLVALKNEILKCWLNSRSDSERSELVISSDDNDGKTVAMGSSSPTL